MPAPLKLAEISSRIKSHLSRMEAIEAGSGCHRVKEFYHAVCGASGSRVMIRYKAYFGTYGISKTEALEYLSWLDAGNHGTHWTQQKLLKEKAQLKQ